MPKIEVYQDALYRLAGKNYANHLELERELPNAKAELDEVVATDGILKIELNDTNRPDLWSTAGLARALRVHRTSDLPAYRFFSRPGDVKDAGARQVVVDAALKDIRPYIAAFAVSGKQVDDAALKDMIQSQEKLCWNYGRKRRSIAMGIYRSARMVWPVRYLAADPDKTAFVPLGMSEKLTLRQIIEKHPKGQEFGHIVAGFRHFPYLTDDKGAVLSFPPVINSADIGAVEVGDSELFIELTGTDLPSLLLACGITACDFADLGFTVHPVKVVYPYDTPMGREITTPVYFQEPVTGTLSAINKLLGESFTAAEVCAYLAKMGCVATADAGSDPRITLIPPEYRNDFLHPVDIVEDVAMGKGIEAFDPVMPADFTVGALAPAEIWARKIVPLMVGMGFQEMIFNYLGSGKDFIEKMNIDGAELVQVANPMSENFEFVRSSALPQLLLAESGSANAVYPHRVFEVGKVCRLDDAQDYGSVTLTTLAFLNADAGAGFNETASQVNALLYFLNAEFTLEEASDPRFIPGRCARVRVAGKDAGLFGEISPAVLENFGITVPCSACELVLDAVMER